MHWARFTRDLFSEYFIYSFEKSSMPTGHTSSLLNFVGLWPVHLLTAILQFHTYSDSLREFSIFLHRLILLIGNSSLPSLKGRRRVWRVAAENYDTNFGVDMITNRPGHVVPHWKGLRNAYKSSELISLDTWQTKFLSSHRCHPIVFVKELRQPHVSGPNWPIDKKTFWGTKGNILPNWFRLFYVMPVFLRLRLSWHDSHTRNFSQTLSDVPMCMELVCVDGSFRISRLSCIIWACFLFNPLPLQHPQSLSLLLFIHVLQQFGQVTIQTNHRMRKWTSRGKKKKKKLTFRCTLLFATALVQMAKHLLGLSQDLSSPGWLAQKTELALRKRDPSGNLWQHRNVFLS